MINILFLGQKKLGEDVFKLLISKQTNEFKIKAVCTNQQDDVWWNSNQIWNYCRSNQICCVDNAKRNTQQMVQIIQEKGINFIISVQHPWILQPCLLEKVNYHALNLHNAKLPDYKGHNCCNHAILNNEAYYTSTLHWMVNDVDMGNIAYEKRVEIDTEDSAKSLYAKAHVNAVSLIEVAIENLINHESIPTKPLYGEGVFYPRNSLDSFREIQSMNDLIETYRIARALYFPPFEPAFIRIGESKLYLLPQNFHASVLDFESFIVE